MATGVKIAEGDAARKLVTDQQPLQFGLCTLVLLVFLFASGIIAGA